MIPIIGFDERHARLAAVFNRDASFSEAIAGRAAQVIEEVRTGGDAALLELTERFDGVRPSSILVPPGRLREAAEGMDAELRGVILKAADNIRRFHERQRQNSWFVEDGDGVVLGQRVVAMDRVGLYVPGGKAVYPSSLLMNAIPAQVAGVPEIFVASPPGADGMPSPLVLATAHLLGIRNVYAVGGAQAVAAFAFGTESVPRVDLIAGPGNAYVAAAKKLVFGRVAIDAIAGPSEIVVLADSTADPRSVAADLLSQAEHDERASAILVTTDHALAEAVGEWIERFTAELPRRAIIEASLRDYGACIVAPDLDAACALVNELAPEHLEIITREPWTVMTRIRHAGAIFLGPFAPEPVGDYFAGPNHVLPTGGTARYASALNVDQFVRKQSVIAYSKERIERVGRDIMQFARAESLDAHALSIQVRLDGTASQ